MRPTLDGLNADQWFTLARVMGEGLLLCVLLWFAGRAVRRGLRHLADHRRAKRERHEEWLDAVRRRQFRSSTPPGYLRERGNGAVTDEPTPWPFKG